MKIYRLLLIAAIGLLLWQCKKEDNIPPEIKILLPLDGSLLHSRINIQVEVTDNEGITEVQFFVDNELLETLTEEPYEIEWNTKHASDGEHTLQCKAIDNSGNTGSSESVLVNVVNSLLTVNFTNGFCPDCGNWIFYVSDMDGNVIKETIWEGSSHITLKTPDELDDIPESIIVTIVEPSTSGSYMYLTSFMDIPVGSSWTYKNYNALTPDYNISYVANFDFTNIPAHEGYIISNKWTSRSSSYSSIYSPLSYYFYENPADIYFRLNTTDYGPQYLWLENITEGDYYIDLSNLSDMAVKTIDMGSPGVEYDKYLYGYITPGSRYAGNFRLDYGWIANPVSTYYSVSYPPSMFSDYRTSLYLYTDENHDSYWYQSVYGDIPDSFDKPGADFGIMNVSPLNFRISATSSDFTEIHSNWRANFNEMNMLVYWNVYSPSDITSYSLPNFSDYVNQYYSYIDKASFELQYVDLVEFPELNSYQERVATTFNPDVYFYDAVNEYRLRSKYYNPVSTKSARISSNGKREINQDPDMLFINVGHSNEQ